MKEKMISTTTLLRRLFKTTNLSRFVNTYREQMNPVPFHVYISRICDEKEIV